MFDDANAMMASMVSKKLSSAYDSMGKEAVKIGMGCVMLQAFDSISKMDCPLEQRTDAIDDIIGCLFKVTDGTGFDDIVSECLVRNYATRCFLNNVTFPDDPDRDSITRFLAMNESEWSEFKANNQED